MDFRRRHNQHHQRLQNHTNFTRDASSALRRTHTIAVATVTSCGEESSISSLGSFPTADLVAQQFTPSSRHGRQSAGVDSPLSSLDALVEDGRKIKVYNVRDDPSGANQRYCPHCRKKFSNPWAVPKHVMRVHNRAGEFHCPRCTFKTKRQEDLLQHEKDSHRKCPYCRQLFVLLNKHIGTCAKRPLSSLLM